MTSSEKILRLILGDQLNSEHSWFQQPDDRVTYLMMEIRQETDYVKHHIQKVAAFFAAMRAFADHLKESGHRIIYFRFDDPQNRQTLHENIEELVQREGFTRFEYLLPDEYRLDQQLYEICRALPQTCVAYDTEHFLTGRDELKEMFAGKKRFLMEAFYRRMRKRFSVLIDKEKPVGGKWNFDVNNRRPYDGKVPIPKPLAFDNDVKAIADTIRLAGIHTLGKIDQRKLIWPIDRSQALALLDHFIQNGLPQFGTYQDAMTRKSWSLFHCRLSFALNTKMLSPMEVINASLNSWKGNPKRVAVHQVEGFVRQILGWREYMRGIYWAMMPELAEMNFLAHDLPLPDFYWTGDTRMSCLAETIGQSLTRAYAHHIQRLMVTGNFALLAGVQPDALDAWYLGIYIDAIQWVELPNTRAMSQFADGGVVATKPYVSSANYIRKMSDYCKDCSYDSKEKYGTNACPFNSLYWHFYERHRKKLESNPRIVIMYRTWDLMSAAERKSILRQAEIYLSNLNAL